MHLVNTNPDAPRPEARGTRAMAATSQPLATLTAVDILNEGGSAVDAAIAANAMLGLVEPTGSGLGGDLFAMVWDPSEKKLSGLNASGRSPASLDLDKLRELAGPSGFIPNEGPLCVSTPGCVSGWFSLHERFGRLPVERLLSPAIRRAREGFPVTPVIAAEWKEDIARFRSARDYCTDSSGFFKTFAPGGRAPAAGETFANPSLASTYERIARGGQEAFYEGFVAERIEQTVRRQGGFLTRDDLASHRPEWVDPIATPYRGYRIFELPPNGQGLTVLQMLNILEGFPLAEYRYGSIQSLHIQIEAKKLAFEDRARLFADPDFSPAPIDRLLSESYTQELRSRIQSNVAWTGSDAPVSPAEGGDTVFLTTADSNGMMVSFIQSNYMGLGSGLVPDGLGFGLQNRGALFCLQEGHANVYAPGKRPFHTIIPAFVFENDRPLMSFGVMGGAMQPQGHVQILTNMIDFGMSLQQAGDALRWRHIGSSQPTGSMMMEGGEVLLEVGTPEAVAEGLREKGHRIRFESGAFGGYQAIARDPDTGDYIGASESRKDGMALGF